MTAIALPVLKELEPGTGDSLGVDAARRALEENDVTVGDELETDDNAAAGAKSGGTESGGEHHAPVTVNGDSGPAAEKAAEPSAKPSARELRRRVRRMKLKELQPLYVELLDRHEKLEQKLDQLTRESAVVQAIGDDVIDEDAKEMARDIVELIDSIIQLLAKSAKMAAALALEADESERLTFLLGRVLKRRARALLLKAGPEGALATAAISIVLGKLIAFRVAKLELTDNAGGASV